MTDDSGNSPQSAACAARDFEHHERAEVTGSHEWKCPECGATGSFEALFAKLQALQPQLWRLQGQMLDHDAVFLLPSDATPGLVGRCFGRDVYRLPGIPGPLLALSAGELDLKGARLLAQTLVFEISPASLPPVIRVAVRPAHG